MVSASDNSNLRSDSDGFDDASYNLVPGISSSLVRYESTHSLEKLFLGLNLNQDQPSKQPASTLPSATKTAKSLEFSSLMALVDGEEIDEKQNSAEFHTQQANIFMNAPIFTSGVAEYVQSNMDEQSARLIPQYGLLGIQQDSPGFVSPEDRLVLANMNIPWSTFICGSQGAGKSHTLSCLLEAYIDANSGAGSLPSPLAGIVMHYDNFTNNNTTQLCEAAYLCSSGIPVNILVCPSNIWTMKRLYSNLPGMQTSSPRPKVFPLYLTESQLNSERILKLMAVDTKATTTPLYMEFVMKIIREMAMEGPGFTYTEFRHRLAEVQWVRGQDVPLNMRLQLLDSFIAPSPLTRSTRPAQAEENIWAFKPGSLTIVDLSDPFVSSDDACALFSICLSIFLEDRDRCGRVVALDEAHKFLVQSGEARILTDEFTSIIRQQRHTGTRVIIATQEPTLAPELIDLANATIVHRFLSPAWYEILKKHLAGANKKDSGNANTLFDTIVALRTGEALLFCPTAQLKMDMRPDRRMELRALGNGYAKVRVRKRTSADGGRSISATENSSFNKAMQLSADDVPMFVVTAKAEDTEKSLQASPSSSKNTGKRGKTEANRSGSGPGTIMPNEAQSTGTSSVATSNASTVVSAKKIRMAANNQAQLRAEQNWPLFNQLKKSQLEQIYSGAEKYLNLAPGTFANNGPLRGRINEIFGAALARIRKGNN